MPDQSFNKPAPPGFRGMDPNLPVRFYRRHLPHWRQQGATYFVTFRLADSIPQHQLNSLKRWRTKWEKMHPEPRNDKDWEELARQITNRTEAWMDEGYGECVFQHLELQSEMSNALLYFQDERCQTSCFTILPNHVHVVIKPLDNFELEDVLESIKRFVSGKVNRFLDRSGKLWEQESYDRIIRDEEHLYRVVQYIGRNPGKARLPIEKWVRWLHPAWKTAGWSFCE